MHDNNQESDVLIVGAGFAGMYAVWKFRQLGLKILVLEAGSDVGGTWYWNRYPGARCDVPSLEYSYGFSEELYREWDWPEVFSAQPDILRYANHVADRFSLRDDIRFNTRVTAVTWDDDSQSWTLDTDTGEAFTAPFCIMATGCLSVPNQPSIKGADLFEGPILHTGRWPHEDPDLSGSRVGIIGTGSSGVQAIPELAKMSKALTVFQRTPVYTVPANRKQMRAAVQDEFRDNFAEIHERQRNSPGGVSGFRPVRSVRRPAGDTGQSFQGGLVSAVPGLAAEGSGGMQIKDLSPEQRQAVIDQRGLGALLSFRDIYSDSEANELGRELFAEQVRRMVRDPEVAESLVPKDYGLGCKRQVLDRDYYDTFNRDNVTLVDVQATPIECITPTGIQTAVGHHELDVLIYATGFDAMTGALLKANITGRGGQRLADKWADGPVAYLGLQVHGFPNLFTVTGPGSPSVLCNMIVAIEQHMDWIADCIMHLRNEGLSSIEPAAASEVEWVQHVNEVAEGTMYTAPSCNSWYLGANIEGKPRIFMPYVGGLPRYRDRCEKEAANGYPGFEKG